ncbi:MAG TPA: M56 family metallopeptidase [Longimicrobium sp.]|nr:M56 family metallopeptidase [Longimicrobium sp.]
MKPLLLSLVHLSPAVLAGVAWLLTYALHSSVLLGGAWALLRWGRVRGEAAADLLWKTALLGGIVTATAGMMMSAHPLGWRLYLPNLGPVAMRASMTYRAPGAPPVAREWVEAGPLLPVSVRVVALAVLAVWGTLAVVRVVRLVLAHRRLRRCLAGRREVGGEPARILAELMGGRPARLTCSELLPGPVALGRAEVCLPTRVLYELSPGEQRSILAHEAAHLLRRDPLWLNLLTAIASVFAFQPLNALALRRYSHGAELLCDQWAARATGRPAELARSIVRVAGWLAAMPQRAPLPAMVEGGSPFVQRVQRLASPDREMPAETRWRGAAWMLLMLATVLAAAPSFAAPAPPKPGQMHFLRVTQPGDSAAPLRTVREMSGDSALLMRRFPPRHGTNRAMRRLRREVLP